MGKLSGRARGNRKSRPHRQAQGGEVKRGLKCEERYCFKCEGYYDGNGICKGLAFVREVCPRAVRAERDKALADKKRLEGLIVAWRGHWDKSICYHNPDAERLFAEAARIAKRKAGK
jgi:hypothetical protein